MRIGPAVEIGMPGIASAGGFYVPGVGLLAMQLDTSRRRIADLKDRMVEAIPRAPDTAETRAELAAKPFDQALHIYVNWIDRFIPPRPRRVHYLDDFWSAPAASKLGGAVLEIEREISEGADLTARLSDRVHTHGFVPDRDRKPGKRRGIEWDDKDFALNAFDVHHLHLGRSGARGDALLFATFGRSDAVMTLLGDHRSFDNGSAAAAAARRDLALNRDLRDLHPSREPFDDRQRSKLARRGLTTAASVEGRTVIANAINGVGTTIDTIRQSDEIVECLAHYDPQLDRADFVRDLLKIDGAAPVEPAWYFDHADLVLFEAASRRMARLVHGRR